MHKAMHSALFQCDVLATMEDVPTRSPRDAKDRMRISTVARLLGVPVPTIRSWERRYGFPAPPRTDGQHRRYGHAELEQLRVLRDLVTRGHSTRDAVTLARAAGVTQAEADSSPADAIVAAAMALDPAALRATLDASAGRLGVEDTIRHAILPAMREIGSRWKAGRCDVGHEHLASEGVRAWLARQAFLAPQPFRSRPIVLACGPKDLHTIGLESFAVILARRGWPCRVLGAMTPPAALVATVRSTRAIAAVVTAQRSVTRRAAVAALESVGAVRGVHAFYAGDAFGAPAARRDVKGIYLGDDLAEATRVIESTVS
jgi:MerR family transcriptional regulator, light-induced transcriptional regulator